MTTRICFWTRCEKSMVREIANNEQNLGVNWPVMFDERAQRSCSSVFIITSWHLHVQVFAVGESTGDESTYCIVIKRMPTWNSRKSRTTTNCCSKTSVHTAFKKITAWVLLIVEFNEVNMMALKTRLSNLASGKRWSDNQSIFQGAVISLTKVGIHYL